MNVKKNDMGPVIAWHNVEQGIDALSSDGIAHIRGTRASCPLDRSSRGAAGARKADVPQGAFGG